MEQTQTQTQGPVGGLFSQYGPIAGVFDEALTSTGSPRAEWSALVEQLDVMGETELRKRWNVATAQIERNGVTFNPHDDEGLVSRPWMLDAIPMVLAEAEWNRLSARLSQRARVLDALLKDLFGEQRLLKEKIIPPELLFAHPAWYPSYQNLNPPDRTYLDYCATELARDAAGNWTVTGDRTRSPFGIGYVLENRVVTSRMLSNVFRRIRVKRLAGFYATLKERLRNLSPGSQENPRIVLWTKGPQSRGYFEDSYLARYLGYTLAEGDDLAVRDGRVQLLTLGGLLPVEVLLRRLDDDECDSVELNPNSTIGISALLDMLRVGKVSVANALGSRLIESPAYLRFLPAVSQFLLGEELQTKSARTWWCGDANDREFVLANIGTLLIRNAFRMDDKPPIVGHLLSSDDRRELISQINAEPQNFAAQEIIPRSTTPVLTDNGVEPWYVGLRTFSVAAKDGYQTLPGGLARVSPNSESLNFTMTAGERSQDVWILSESPVENISLMEAPSVQIAPRRSGADLPSRVADNFFWLGRYAERSSQTARLLRALFNSLESEDGDGPENEALLRVLANHGQIDPDHVVPELRQSLADVMEFLPAAVFDGNRPMSLRSSVGNTVRTASQVRDRLSTDMWRVIDRVNSQMLLASKVSNPASIDMLDVLENLLADLAAFTGHMTDSMIRALGWQFLDMGLRIERCWQTTVLLRSFFCNHRNDDPETLEALLSVTDGLMTYRNRYLATFQVPVVLDLLMTDTTNPRSLIFQLQQITSHVNAMPGNENQALLSPEQKVALSLEKMIRLVDIYEVSEIDPQGVRQNLRRILAQLEKELPKISDALTSRFLIHAGLPRHFASTNENR